MLLDFSFIVSSLNMGARHSRSRTYSYSSTDSSPPSPLESRLSQNDVGRASEAATTSFLQAKRNTAAEHQRNITQRHENIMAAVDRHRINALRQDDIKAVVDRRKNDVLRQKEMRAAARHQRDIAQHREIVMAAEDRRKDNIRRQEAADRHRNNAIRRQEEMKAVADRYKRAAIQEEAARRRRVVVQRSMISGIQRRRDRAIHSQRKTFASRQRAGRR
ncbi:uncharacterized protein V6R79_017732 [Siganus canaliculatus]